MSRSYRKPYTAVTGTQSAHADKKMAARGLRRGVHAEPNSTFHEVQAFNSAATGQKSEKHKAMPTDIFAERRLHLRSNNEVAEVLVQFGPVIRKNGAAFCRYKVSGPHGTLSDDIWGVDDVQAVELAMKMAGSDLDRIAHGGNYSIADTSDGDAGHGLPSFASTSRPKH